MSQSGISFDLAQLMDELGGKKQYIQIVGRWVVGGYRIDGITLNTYLWSMTI